MVIDVIIFSLLRYVVVLRVPTLGGVLIHFMPVTVMVIVVDYGYYSDSNPTTAKNHEKNLFTTISDSDSLDFIVFW